MERLIPGSKLFIILCISMLLMVAAEFYFFTRAGPKRPGSNYKLYKAFSYSNGERALNIDNHDSKSKYNSSVNVTRDDDDYDKVDDDASSRSPVMPGSSNIAAGRDLSTLQNKGKVDIIALQSENIKITRSRGNDTDLMVVNDTIHVAGNTDGDSHHITDDTYQNNNKVRSDQLIVVLAQWRFGSSVVGQLFNQNHDIFYIFEPLWTVRDSMMRDLRGDQQKWMSREMLRGFAKCKFSDDFVRNMTKLGGWPGNRAIREHCTKCASISSRRLQHICMKYKARGRMLATKVIRADLELLRPLVVEDGIDLKIVHLVRDPRGSAASRINYALVTMNSSSDPAKQPRAYPNRIPETGRLRSLGLLSTADDINSSNIIGALPDTIQFACQWMRENAKTSSDVLPDWLRGRYHLVRYEDFAAAPLDITKELYGFVGMPLTRDVREWVVRNTRSAKGSQRHHLFSTRRDSKTTARGWMTFLSHVEVEQVERECMDVMELLNYKVKRVN